MRILGIDPGSLNTGYGVVESDGSGLKVIASGCIKNKGKDKLGERYYQIYSGLKDIIKKINPKTVSFEKIIYCNNTTIAIKLGEARGAAIVAAAEQHIPIAEYAPKKIKQAVTGYGGASKIQVQNMVMRLLNLNALPQSDTADALAAAICHIQNVRLEEKMENRTR